MKLVAVLRAGLETLGLYAVLTCIGVPSLLTGPASDQEPPISCINIAFKALGILTTLAGMAIPSFTTMRDIRQAQTVGRRSSVLYVVGWINFALWVFFPNAGWLMIVVNVSGMAMMAVYFIYYLYFCEDQETRLCHLVFPLIGLIGTVVILAYYFSDRENNALFMCWVCAMSRGLLGLVPLIDLGIFSTMQRVPSLLLSVTALANAIFWIGFASTIPKMPSPPGSLKALNTDGFIWWPSLLGAVCAAILILVHIVVMCIEGLLQLLLEPLHQPMLQA